MRLDRRRESPHKADRSLHIVQEGKPHPVNQSESEQLVQSAVQGPFRVAPNPAPELEKIQAFHDREPFLIDSMPRKSLQLTIVHTELSDNPVATCCTRKDSCPTRVQNKFFHTPPAWE